VTVDGLAVGNVGIGAVEHVHGTAWVSYWLAAEHRGRGLAAAALAGASAWAVQELGTFRLELGHRVNNPASCRVATRAGYLAEGVERAKLRYGSERFDVETHARLATDPAPAVTPVPVRL
jgi:ribosomal-protein-alanine N-acetyltransferase